MHAGPASQSRNEKARAQSRPAPGVVARERVISAKHPPEPHQVMATTPNLPESNRHASMKAPSAPMTLPIAKNKVGDLLGRDFRRAAEVDCLKDVARKNNSIVQFPPFAFESGSLIR